MGHLPKLAVITYIATVAFSSAATKTTCSASTAHLGQQGSLTCNFPFDVNAKKSSFNVRRADRRDFDYKRDTVLDCDWIEREQMCVTIKDGFTYDYHVSDSLMMIISNVSLEDQGLYSCQVIKEATSNTQSCSLTVLKRESSPRASDGVIFRTAEETLSTTLETPLEEKKLQTAELNIVAIVAPVVIGAVLVVTIVIVVYVVKRRNVQNSDSTASKADGDEEKMLGKPTPPTVTNHSEGQNTASDVEFANESFPRPPTSGVRDDYVKVHKINQEATTSFGDEESDTQYQERQPLTGDPCVTSPAPTTWDDEEEAADKDSANGDDAMEENGDDNGNEHRDDDDDARYNNEDESNSSDDKGKEDEEGPGASKKVLKKMYEPVLNQMKHYNEEGEDILRPVPDKYKRKSAQRDLGNRIKAVTGKKK